MFRFVPGNLLHLSSFRFHSHFARYRSYHVVDNPQLSVGSVRDRCRLGLTRFDNPVSIFHQLDSLRPRPSISTFNHLFSAMIKIKPNPPFSTVITLSNYLQHSGYWPDMHSIGILVTCYCRLGRIDFAFSLLGTNLKLGYQPNTIVIINTLLNEYCLRGEMKEAEKLLDSMAKDGVMLNVVTFNSLINGYCKFKEVDKALEMLQDMHLKRTHITPNVYIYTTVITALCKGRRFPLAIQLFREMQYRGVAPDVFSYNALLGGLLRNYQIDMAVSLHKEMENNGVAPNIVTYSTIINGLCEAGRLVEARQMFSTLGAKRLRPDVVIYNTQIKVLCRLGLLGDATRTLEEMADNGISPNERTYDIIIKGCLNCNDIALALGHLHIMRNQNFVLNVNTTSLFRNLLTARDVSDKDKALLQKYFPEYDGEEKRMNEANCDGN